MTKGKKIGLITGIGLLAGAVGSALILYYQRKRLQQSGQKLQRTGRRLQKVGRAAEKTGRRLDKLSPRS